VTGSSAGPQRHGRPVSRIDRSTSSTGRLEPIGKSACRALNAATGVTVSSGSKRTSDVGSAPTSEPTSRVTAANSSFCETPRATSVATLRSAACSSAIRVASARAGIRTASSPWSAADAVADGGVDARERHPVDNQFDVIVEHVPPDVEVPIVERLVVAAGEIGG
jgi:hypothetical protein